MLATVGFLVCVILISAGIVWPYFTGQFYYYEDAAVRDNLAGSVDTILSGSSHGYCAFNPNVLDEELGTSSYNLSGSLMTMQARAALLRRELDRNPVETVFIELSFNTLTRDRSLEGAEGDIYTLPRIGSLFGGIGYFFEAIRPGEYLNVCADTLDRGLQSWKDLLRGEDPKIEPADRGLLRRDSQDLSMTADEFNQLYNAVVIGEEAHPENKAYLCEMIELCQSRDIEVIFVTTPVSDWLLAEYSNLEPSHQWSLYYAQQYGCQYLDFNLYRQRDALFPDETAFYDKAHLSETGSETFSRELADLYVRLQNGEDITPLFYENYDEMKQALYASYNSP